MKRKTKILSLAIVLIAMFGISLAGNFLVMPDVEPVIIEKPDMQFQIAVNPASDAIATGANNITNTNGAAGSNYVFAGAYEQYILVANVSDADGYADILNVTIEFAKGAVSYGGFECDVAVGTATVTVTEMAANAGNVRLSAGSTNISAGLVIDITIPFYFEWDIGAQTDMDINVTVWDATDGIETAKNANIDIVATLTASDATLFPYSDYLNGALFGGMELTYHYTGYTTTYPLAAETDFWVSRAAVPVEGIGARAWDSTAYAEGTGIAEFDDIIAPDSNTRQELTFTLYAVDQSGGSADTSLMAVTTTDTVWIDPNAPTHPTDDDSPFISPDIFGTPEGVMLIGGAVVVIGAGTYYFYGRNKTTPTRRRSKRRKPAKKKTKRKRRSSK